MTTLSEILETEHVDLFLSGAIVLIDHLNSYEKNESRLEKKKAVLDEKVRQFEIKNPDLESIDLKGVCDYLISKVQDRESALNLLIDLMYSDPYDPYELYFRDRDFECALVKLGERFGISEGRARELLKTKKDAQKAHRSIRDYMGLLVALVRIVIVAVGGFLFAPILGAAVLGFKTSVLGLSMVNHWLSVAGIQALDPVYAGLMGGQMMVRGVGTLSASMISGYRSRFDMLDSASAKIEIGKLQVSFVEIFLRHNKLIEARGLIEKLEGDISSVEEHLENERKLNEKYSARIRELQYTKNLIANAIKWMRGKLNSVAG